MLLLDLSHTSHTTAQTGIQRVCRALHKELSRSHAVEPVTYDPYHYTWRSLAAWERANLQAVRPAQSRGSRWPLSARLAGSARKVLKSTPPRLPAASDGLIVPELFSPEVAAHFPELFESVKGPRVALFHDAIALKYPELTPPKTVGRFPSYLRDLLVFDGIAAVSEDSRSSLLDFWNWVGVERRPPVIALPLPLMAPVTAKFRASGSPPTFPTVLTVGSIEGRKNHLALLEACESLWQKGSAFSLRMIGLAHPQTGRAALERIRSLQAAGRPLRYDGPVDDATLEQAYAECAFTVYPSLIEGFGLPVLESLAHHKPCICSAKGALGESARGGGCRALESVDPLSLAAAITELLGSASYYQELCKQAACRVFRTWPKYTADLRSWMATLARRS